MLHQDAFYQELKIMDGNKFSAPNSLGLPNLRNLLFSRLNGFRVILRKKSKNGFPAAHLVMGGVGCTAVFEETI